VAAKRPIRPEAAADPEAIRAVALALLARRDWLTGELSTRLQSSGCDPQATAMLIADLVQDIFLHAFKKLHTLRDGSAFGPWIAMITRNRAVDFHRRSRETVEITDEVRGSEKQEAKAAEILELIRNLPEAYRETLVLRLVEGMTGPEIAERTGLTPASVRVNLHRGMKLLREKLGFTEAL